MSLDGLLKTKVDLYRAADIGDKYGDPSSVPVLVSRDIKVRFDDPLRLKNDDDGPGGSVDGEMVMLTTARRGKMIQTNDIVKFASGVEMPWPTFKINTIYRPNKAVMQMWVVPYKGPLA
jgi:hypothetical protein